jgi:hypothetical protein
MIDISIVIVSWNVKDRLLACLQSVFANIGNLSVEVFVVDNDSKDGTVEMLKGVGAYGNTPVHVIANTDNLGFARANNQGLKLAQGKYLLLLNPDMQVLHNTLDGMVKFMDENPGAGIAGCHLMSEADETVSSVRRFPGVLDQAMLILKIPHVFPGVMKNYLMPDFDYNKISEVDSVRGSFFMIRREVYQLLGGLDERYFVWFEEVDYCRAAKRAGFKVMYNPGVKAIDHVGQSFIQLKNLDRQKKFIDSMLKYFYKWEARWQYQVLRMLRPIGLLLVKVKDIIVKN